MSQPELLIDRLYRQTFRKPPFRDESLRDVLTKAKRFVLDDAMASFLVDLHHAFFLSRKPSFKRLYRRLDELRHFSRLPHAITWVEYSHYVVLARSRDYHDGIILPKDLIVTDEEIEKTQGERVGWLMRQHGKIDTAFTVSKFENREDRDGQVFYTPPCDFVWVTDDAPSPWRFTPLDHEIVVGGVPLIHGSELATATSGYVRDNVGYRCAGLTHEKTMQAAMREVPGVHNWFWIFLSTLNKIPLVTLAEIAASHGFVARGAYRRFLDHTTVTLHIPEMQRRKIARATVIEVMRRRAHMVRGHWRDDWTLPKGNKSLWIGEHQRGDASLGWVDHSYDVKHGPN